MIQVLDTDPLIISCRKTSLPKPTAGHALSGHMFNLMEISSEKHYVEFRVSVEFSAFINHIVLNACSYI